MADTLESLEIEVKHSASGAAEEINSVASAISSVAKALDKALPNLKVFNDLMGKGTVSVANNSTTQVADTINNVNQAASKAQRATQEAGKGIKEMSKAASKSKGPLDNFVGSLKRIAFYRVIRSVIKSITQAFAEGLQNAYAFSQGIEGEGHRFAEAMDSMKTAGATMKNQLGSAFIGLLTAIAPIVNQIIALVTKIADALSQIFAIFTGGTYLKAAGVPQKWADSAGGAAKAAKEWKNQLMGFDEINRLNEPNDGGGGGGGGVADVMSAFEDTPIDGIFKKIRDEIIEFKDSLDLEPIRKAWERLKESAERLADAIGKAFKWLWDNILAPLVRWTIEKLLPVVLDIISSATNLAVTIGEKLGPVIDWLWQNILKPLFQFVGEVVIDRLESLNDLLKEIEAWVDGKITFKEFIEGLSKSEGFISRLISVLSSGKLTWEEFGNIAVLAIEAPIRQIIDAISAIQTLCGWIQTAIDGLNALNFVKNANSHAQAIWDSGEIWNGLNFASGGFPEEGQLFMAREAGPEMVGTIGGHTAVANNDQIVEAIRGGVFDGVAAAMNNGGNDVSVRVFLDSREIKAGQQRLNRAWG